MGFISLEIQDLKKEHNPTDELLTMWSHYNHTLSELFVLLSRMQHRESMIILKPFIDSKYHILLDNRKENLQKLIKNGQLRKDTKDLKIGVQNFNQNLKPHENTIKVIVNNSTKEDSIKILNQSIKDEQQNETPSNSNNLLTSIPAIFSTLLPRIPYNELAVATDNWRKENILGKGGFGTVFKGLFLTYKFILNLIFIICFSLFLISTLLNS
jgi:interleukin-1 receptor-associated kinase 1